ncbi:MAG TPA: 30S ribosomal protein S16 [Candidatus Portnoybacteria bacterium]|nr:30S ribosomal protein S16 [Candidatus Portnoybacteria bacterium]
MLVIRLTRIGKKNQPSYRVVLTEKTNPVRGKFQEILGSYNAQQKTKELKADRIKYWLSKGAQASPTVHNLLVSEKIISDKKVKAWHPKKKTVEARKAKEAEAAKAAEAPAVKEEAPAEEPKATEEVKAE